MLSSELQPAFASGVGERRDAAVVVVATAVEDHGLDAGGLGTLGDQLADLRAVGLLVAVDGAHIGLDGRRRGQRVAGRGRRSSCDVDVTRGAVDDQARTLGRAGDLLAQAEVTAGLRQATRRRDVLAERNALRRSWFAVWLISLTRLSDLAADLLTLVADALALVRVGATQTTDVGRDLADLLLVDARHRELGGRLDREGDALGRLDRHRVAVAERELEVLALECHAVTDAVRSPSSWCNRWSHR